LAGPAHRQSRSRGSPAPDLRVGFSSSVRAGADRQRRLGPRRLADARCTRRGAWRRTVKRHGAGDIARLRPGEALEVAEAHQFGEARRMVETDGMADLVRESVAKIVDIEVAVEADLPALRRIEADDGAGQPPGAGNRVRLVLDIGERPAARAGFGADQDIRAVRRGLAE